MGAFFLQRIRLPGRQKEEMRPCFNACTIYKSEVTAHLSASAFIGQNGQCSAAAGICSDFSLDMTEALCLPNVTWTAASQEG